MGMLQVLRLEFGKFRILEILNHHPSESTTLPLSHCAPYVFQVIPIESSMEGNRYLFPWFLHGAIFILAAILGSFGILGYLKYGKLYYWQFIHNAYDLQLISTYKLITLSQTF